MKPIAIKIIIRSCAVLSAIGFLCTIGLVYQYLKENQTLTNEKIELAKRLADEAQTHLENTLSRITDTVNKSSESIFENRQDDTQHMLMTVRNIIYSDPGFVEAGFAFSPFAYDPKIRLYGFSYTVDKDGMQLQNLDVNEDYTKPEVIWYQKAMEGKAVWLEPEYDEILQKMLVTYAVPVFKQEDATKPVGVVFATYSVSNFKRILDNMDLGENGYSFLLSPEKRFIIHRNQDYIDHRWSLNDFLKQIKDTSTVKEVNNALSDSSHLVHLKDPESGQDSQIFFQQIPVTGWILGILLNDGDMVIPSSVARIKLMRMVLLLCLSIILLTITLSGIQHGSIRGFWILSAVFTICCIVSYVTGLRLMLTHPPRNFVNSLLITNQNTLNKFMSDQRRRTLGQREEVPLFIPTGIYIQSISFDQSIGGIAINGYLWQKYSLGIHDGIERGFVIPGSDSFELAEPLTNRSGNTELVRWGFKATLYQDFDFSKYPFGREYVQIDIRHKQFTRNIILVPDLDSYKIINPTTLPGMQNDIYLHGWNLEKSYFNYKFENYSTSFGLNDYSGLTDFPELVFNIEISKQTLGAVISHALPLAVVALLLFALLLLSTNMEVGKLEVVEAIAACAGFFLVIIFSHIGLRESFAVKDIIYLEYYYYIIYVLILFTVANYVIIATQKQKDRFDITPMKSRAFSWARILRYKDNLPVKILYWPLSQLAVLILTLLEFY